MEGNVYGVAMTIWQRVVVILCLSASSVFSLTGQEIQDIYYKSYNYEKMGNYDDAIKALSLVQSEYPNGYTVHIRLAYLHGMLAHYANAIDLYKKAAHIVPTALDASLGLQLIYLVQEKYGLAEALGNQVIKSDYYSYYGNLRLAISLRKQKKLDQAQKILTKMLSVYPIDVLYLTEYGQFLYEKKELEASYGVFYDILTLDPENVTAKQYLAIPNS